MWPFVIALLLVGFGVACFTGAPYVPILGQDRRHLLDLAELKAGQTLIDLGSGDGRLLYAAAQRGLTAIGYEINPIMILVSWAVCWRYRRRVTIRWANLWTVKLPPADIIYVFLLDKYMDRLDAKLQAEITQPTIVISYVFKLPRQPIRTNATASVYCYGPIEKAEPLV
ncbi:MAG TPA: hypothetical protein VI322_02055 [Candidatus Saccharimonadia bacterium]